MERQLTWIHVLTVTSGYNSRYCNLCNSHSWGPRSCMQSVSQVSKGSESLYDNCPYGWLNLPFFLKFSRFVPHSGCADICSNPYRWFSSLTVDFPLCLCFGGRGHASAILKNEFLGSRLPFGLIVSVHDWIPSHWWNHHLSVPGVSWTFSTRCSA